MTESECVLGEFLIGAICLALGLWWEPGFLLVAPIPVILGIVGAVILLIEYVYAGWILKQ